MHTRHSSRLRPAARRPQGPSIVAGRVLRALPILRRSPAAVAAILRRRCGMPDADASAVALLLLERA